MAPDPDTQQIATTTPNDSDVMQKDQKGTIIITCVIPLTLLTLAFAAARLYVRGRILRRLQWDDGLIAASVVSGWVASGTSIAAVLAGHGRHGALLSQEQTERILVLSMVGFATGIVSFALPKVAVVALVCRLLNPTRLHRVFLWGLVGFCLVGLLGNIFGLLAQCTPDGAVLDGGGMSDETNENNNRSLLSKACLGPENAVYYAISTSAISALTNLYIALYVALAVGKTKVAGKKKVAITTAVGLGCVGLVTAIYKCTRLKALGSPDFTYDSADLVIWTCVEGSTIIIAACIPVLQPLVDVLVTKTQSGWARTTLARSRGSRPSVETSSNWSSDTMVESGLGRIEIQRQVVINYTSALDPPAQDALYIMKSKDSDGTVTTTVAVTTSAEMKAEIWNT